MRKLQKVKVTIDKGKEVKSEEIDKPRKVVDSAAEYYELQANSMIQNAKDSGKLQIIEIYKDLGEVKKPSKKKAKPEDSKTEAKK